MFIVTSSFCFAFITDVLLAEIRCGPLQTYLEINKKSPHSSFPFRATGL